MPSPTISGPAWRPLAWAGYPLAALLVMTLVADMSESLHSTVPFWGIQWRFAIMGFVIGSLPQVVLGFALATITSAVLGHGRTARTFSVLQIIFALVLIVGTGIFLLDYLQLRPNVNPDSVAYFDRVSVRSGVTGALAGVFIIAVAVGSWQVARDSRNVPRPRPTGASPADKLVPR